MFSLPVERNIKLSSYTTFKIGGPADYFFLAKNENDLIKIINEAKAEKINYLVLGNGSNILISDDGFKGLIIKLEMNSISIEGEKILADAGLKIGDLLSKAKESGLSGLEFLSGIPATVGGAVWANAGSDKENIGNIITRITVINSSGEIKEINKEEAQFKYRDSIFKHQDLIILKAELKLNKADIKEIENKMKVCMEKKIQAQELNKPSIGSIFKNPEGEKKAWELIEQVGMRGYKMGGAQVSEKHANFIINTGTATASDVIMLISLIKQKVRDTLGVQLMEEIKYIGF
ncbi:MAG: UDP-N-acetylmuramate dehydrogenase [Patescibacteria group bacterium]|jgi:UDP-N-acetylmuramate dehydrogenase